VSRSTLGGDTLGVLERSLLSGAPLRQIASDLREAN
jgi:hypothetical protein